MHLIKIDINSLVPWYLSKWLIKQKHDAVQMILEQLVNFVNDEK